jgi:hypothetical protein
MLWSIENLLLLPGIEHRPSSPQAVAKTELFRLGSRVKLKEPVTTQDVLTLVYNRKPKHREIQKQAI